MPDRTWTELEVYCEKMGWDPETVTQADVERVGGKRGREGHWDRLVNSDAIYKQCDVCGLKIMVNNWPDRKARTPKLAGFILCVECDPRHREDRYLREGYRILHPRRLRVLRQSQIAHVMARAACFKDGKKKCKCPSCTARKVLP